MRPTREKLADAFQALIRERGIYLPDEHAELLARRALELIPEGGPTEAERELVRAILKRIQPSGAFDYGDMGEVLRAAVAVRAERAPKPRFTIKVKQPDAAPSRCIVSDGEEIRDTALIARMIEVLNSAHERGELP